MELLEPPYNYNVFRGDVEGFVRAVTDAISHPIQRHADAKIMQLLANTFNIQLRARGDAFIVS
jgi:hypothetical protein